MSGIAVGVSGITLSALYSAAFEEQKARLLETAHSQARLIEAIARHEEVDASRAQGLYPHDDPFTATLGILRESHGQFAGFGETGEFTLAKHEDGEIVFLLSHRHADLEDPQPVPFAEKRAEPMRLALSEESGTVVGLDYRGEQVLAAHEPVKAFDLGVVAKIDLSEVRAPLIRAGLFAVGGAGGLIFLGIMASLRIGNPIVRNLEESERKYRGLFDSTADSIVVVDPETGRFLGFNDRAHRHLGYTREEFQELTVADVGADSSTMGILQRADGLGNGSGDTLETRMKTKEGEVRDALVSATMISVNGKPCLSSIWHDVTEQKRAEQRIAALARFPSENPNPVLRVAQDGTLLYANAASAALLNAWQCREGERLLDRWQRFVLDALSSEEGRHAETELDGRAFSLTFAPVVDSGYVNVYGLDVTARRSAEDALRVERDNLQAIFQAMEDGVYIVNRQYDIQYANDAIVREFGPFEDRKCYRYFHNREEVCPWCKNSDTLAGKTVHWEWYSAKNGKTYDLIDTPLTLPDGSVGKLEIFRDITARKQAEDALQEAHAELELRVEQRTADLTTANRKLGRQIDEKEQAEAALVGQRRFAEMGARVGAALIEHDTLPGMLQPCAEALVEQLDAAFARIWAFNEADQVLELQASAGMYTHCDGPHGRIPVGQGKVGRIAELRQPVLTNAAIGDPEITDQDWARRKGIVAVAGYPLSVGDELTGVVAVFAKQPLGEAALESLRSVADQIALGIDRKRGEEALRESEKRFRLAAETVSDLVYEWDVTSDRLDWFGDVDGTLGYATGKFPRTLAAWFDSIHPGDQSRLASSVDLHRSSTEPIHEEYRIQSSDGTWRYWLDFGSPLLDGRGRPRKWIGACIDVTDRKLAEEALQAGEVRYRSLFENMLEGYAYCKIILDDDGKPVDFVYIEVNDAFEKLTGLERAKTVGSRVTELIPGVEESEPNLFEIYGKVALTGESTRFDLYFEPLGIWLSIAVYSPQREYFVAIFDNISERKLAEEALRENRERIRQQFDELNLVYATTPVGLSLMDRDLRYLRINERLAAMNGPSVEEHVGRTVAEILPDLADDVVPVLQSVIETGAAILDCEVQGTTAAEPNALRHWLVNYYPVKSADGRVWAVGSVVQEITERKSAEERLRQMETQLAHVARVSTLGEMVAGIAHEVNQPLCSVQMLAEAIGNVLAGEGQADLEELRECNAAIVKAVARAVQIIRRLRGFVHPAGSERSDCSINEIVDEAAQLVDVEARRHDAVVRLDASETLPTVAVDRVEIQQVVVNLVRNACEAMSANDGGEREVTVRTELAGEFVEVSVADCGPGLPSDGHLKIFDAFVTTKPSGLGMGLAIATRIVEAHGGILSAASNPDRGATFRFTLPVARAEPSDAEQAKEPSGEGVAR